MYFDPQILFCKKRKITGYGIRLLYIYFGKIPVYDNISDRCMPADKYSIKTSELQTEFAAVKGVTVFTLLNFILNSFPGGVTV